MKIQKAFIVGAFAISLVVLSSTSCAPSHGAGKVESLPTVDAVAGVELAYCALPQQRNAKVLSVFGELKQGRQVPTSVVLNPAIMTKVPNLGSQFDVVDSADVNITVLAREHVGDNPVKKTCLHAAIHFFMQRTLDDGSGVPRSPGTIKLFCGDNDVPERTVNVVCADKGLL